MDAENLISELTFKAVRSSGSGGQHVNKVATKVVLSFDILNSSHLSEDEKIKLLSFLSNRINKSGILVLSSGQNRSQLKNKIDVTKRFLNLIELGLKQEKERKQTKIPKSAKRKRLEIKRKISEKKANRKPPKLD
ncbi:alternative ribosome rescue aminoacyl-tRNA hydrolase ArfB [Winogradskyella sp. KYW1333]|uniref:alternative ribosome rescue aminoacyl-tRNA hydrolase ArfB n=1 Tax=unclassified Winogradskyella TaxID=2615021 RepID=UPI000DF21DAC|nr:alternative ribosome rescue aminoacyl-tRNA hydrolase ArfB [Winogradskyella sp. KYW1333]RCT53825.1 aminoacyl-tRNA hydrolase [Winogradskyella sp. KYW1333]